MGASGCDVGRWNCDGRGERGEEERGRNSSEKHVCSSLEGSTSWSCFQLRPECDLYTVYCSITTMDSRHGTRLGLGSLSGDLKISIQLLLSSSSTPDMITNKPRPFIRLTDRRSTFTIPPGYSTRLGGDEAWQAA